MQRVPREEDPQYQPPPLPLEVISSDRVPWIKPPPVEKAGAAGNGGNGCSMKFEHRPSVLLHSQACINLETAIETLGLVRSSASARAVPARGLPSAAGVLEAPVSLDVPYAGVPRDIGRVLARPATERLPMKGTSPPTQRLAAYDSDEDDDDGGDSDDDEPPPAPVVRVVESTELVADGPESSSPAAPHTHAVGDEDAEGRLKPQDQEKPMEVESSSPAHLTRTQSETRMRKGG
ncbi:hypothetical protein B0H13DRAFT_2336864 [Mycena leptocephala]|nr:hypothetical protein B0H13DRAFT_2336864 [Mycena leptocephala]